MKQSYKSIGATELRKDFDGVFGQVVNGQSIVVNHRFIGSIKLEPLDTKFQDQKKLLGLKAFDAAPKKTFKIDKHKSIKQLYSESIAKKYAN